MEYSFLDVDWEKFDRDWFDDACDIHRIWVNHHAPSMTPQEISEDFLKKYIGRERPIPKEELEISKQFDELRLSGRWRNK